MKIYLAPMEGLADLFLRELIAGCGSYDLVVTEFVRVVDALLPAHVFYKKVPELRHNSQTPDGTAVRVQLLGNNPAALADNAGRALELGSQGIDLNFGCPSKTVNASKGGAILLKEPETLYSVVHAVKQSMPADQPLSAKMRLGYEDTSLLWECAHAIANAGADEIVVHARTKVQGYKPPAHWHFVSEFEKELGIPLVINGEIWNSKDAERALTTANCSALMLGRGAVKDPYLAKQIKGLQTGHSSWQQTIPLIQKFWLQVCQSMPRNYSAGRLKQWLKHLQTNHEEATTLFKQIQTETDIQRISQVLDELN